MDNELSIDLAGYCRMGMDIDKKVAAIKQAYMDFFKKDFENSDQRTSNMEARADRLLKTIYGWDTSYGDNITLFSDDRKAFLKVCLRRWQDISEANLILLFAHIQLLDFVHSYLQSERR